MKIRKITAAASASLMLIGSVGTAGITVPMNVNAIGSAESTQEYGIEYSVAEDGAVLTLASAATGVFEIPESVTIDGKSYPVVEIGKFAFTALDDLTGIKMPDTIKRIDNSAIVSCHNLKTIKFSDNLEEIGDQAVNACEKLEEISIPDSVKSIGSDFLNGCTSLETIRFPENIGYFGDFTFESSKIKSIVFPEKMSGNITLSYLNQLENLTLPKELTGSLTLKYLLKLKNITLTANTAKSIVLCGIPVSTLVLPDDMTAPVYMSGLNSLEDIVLPAGMKEMPEHCLLECDDLRNVIISDGVEKMADYAIDRCTIDTLDISETVKEMGDYAFFDCNINKLIIRNKDIENLGYMISYRNNINVIMGCKGSAAETYAIMHDIEFIALDEENDAELNEGEISLRKSLFINAPELAESIGYTDNSDTVTVPETVTVDGKEYTVAQIDEMLFKYKNGIKSVMLPSTVRIIESNAFYGCSSLASFKVPENITEIQEGTFYGCTSLSGIDFPEKLKKIGSNAFKSCSSLRSAVIPDGVTEIGDSAFAYCDKLSSVKLPSSLTSLEGYVFSNCSSLEAIDIPENVKKIDTDAFSGCKLSGITINNPEAEIVSSDDKVLPVDIIYGHKNSSAQKYAEENNIAFLAVEDRYILRELLEKNPDLLDKYTDKDGVLTVPEKITSDGKEYIINSFSLPEKYRNTAVKTIVFPPSAAFIDADAYSCLPDLEVIELAEGWTELNGVLFSHSNTADRIKLPSTLKSISGFAFANCTGLRTINIPEGIEKINENTFRGCTDLESIELPESMKVIGENAFSNCGRLKTFTIPDGVEEICDSAFAGCSSLESLVFPDSVKNIGNGIVDGDIGLKVLRFPESTENFGTNKISECKQLKELKLPEGLLSIGRELTGNLPYLETLILPDGIVSVDSYAFENCKSLKSVVIPDTVKNIDSHAFSCNDSLESVTLPDNMTSICSETFIQCPKLRNVELPDKISIIESGAFTDCTGLDSIVLPEITKYIEPKAFTNCKISKLTILDSTVELKDFCIDTEIGMIYGYDGSTAQKYAGLYGIDFAAVSFISGDSNCDGRVDLADVVLIMQSLANPSKYGINGTDPSHIILQGTRNADVIGNDGMTNLDALTIQKYKLSLIDSLPVKE